MKNLKNFKKLDRKELSKINGGDDDRRPGPVPFVLCPQCYMLNIMYAAMAIH